MSPKETSNSSSQSLLPRKSAITVSRSKLLRTRKVAPAPSMKKVKTTASTTKAAIKASANSIDGDTETAISTDINESLNEDINPTPSDHITADVEPHTSSNTVVLPSSPSPSMDFDHVNTPEWAIYFQRTVREHEARFNQMDIMVQEITRLRSELEITRAALSASDKRYNQLLLEVKSRHINSVTPNSDTVDHVNMSLDISTKEFPALPVRGTESSIHAGPDTYAARVAAHIPSGPRPTNKRNNTRKRVALARQFQPPSEDQGFSYLYMPIRSRTRPSETRKVFTKLGVPSHRILDICYPTNGMVGILIHNDFIRDATNVLGKCGIKLVENFDPTSPSVIKDPKFAKDDEESRQKKALEVNHNRLMKVLDRLRSPVCFAAARSFRQQSWITTEQYDSFFSSRKVNVSSNIQTASSNDSNANMADLAANFQDNDLDMYQADGETAPTQ